MIVTLNDQFQFDVLDEKLAHHIQSKFDVLVMGAALTRNIRVDVTRGVFHKILVDFIGERNGKLRRIGQLVFQLDKTLGVFTDVWYTHTSQFGSAYDRTFRTQGKGMLAPLVEAERLLVGHISPLSEQETDGE